MLNPMNSIDVVCPAASIYCEGPTWEKFIRQPCADEVFPFEDDIGGILSPIAETHSMTVTHSCHPGYALYVVPTEVSTTTLRP